MVQLNLSLLERGVRPEEGGRLDRGIPEAGLRLERRRDGQLWAVLHGEERPVKTRRLFPWSAQAPHVSLRDAEGEEFHLVRSTDDLDRASRRALDDAVAAAGFVLEVTRVESIDEEVEIRVWRVATRQGERTFQTRRDEWPRETPDGGLLIRDVAGDLYRVPEVEALDRRSRERLWGFVG